MNVVKEVNYKISGRNDLLDNVYGITPAIEDKIGEMYLKVQKKKNSAVKELIDLIQKYPHVPQFKNLLSVLYGYQRNEAKASELHRRILREHPEYLYGKINLALEYIHKQEYEKVPELLGNSLEISELYPYRNEFNYDEVLSYNKAVLLYFIKTNNDGQAEQRFKSMQEIDAESEHTKWAEQQIMLYRLNRGFERMKKENEQRRTVKVVAAKVTDDTEEKPHFNHSIIEQLYCNSLRIPHTVIAEILRLPKDTLLQDLHTVVYDSIGRFKYFHDHTTYTSTTHEFLTHALFLIAELQSPGSLPVVLDMLRQDEDYLEYWFGDVLSEIVEECIISVGLHQTDKLLSFLKEADKYTYARSIVSAAAAQIALHYPERRQEIVQWFKNIFEFFILKKDDERIIDTDLIGLMVWECLDIEAKELMPVIEMLFEENLVGTGICGDWEDVKESFKDSHTDKKKERKTIYEKYNYILDHWSYYSAKKDLEPEEEFDSEELQADDDIIFTSSNPDYSVKETTKIGAQPKVGRNEPCICGSGKKFKKCCGKD